MIRTIQQGTVLIQGELISRTIQTQIGRVRVGNQIFTGRLLPQIGR